MEFEIYDFNTDETIKFNSFEEFVYWFNYTDEFKEIRNIKVRLEELQKTSGEKE